MQFRAFRLLVECIVVCRISVFEFYKLFCGGQIWYMTTVFERCGNATWGIPRTQYEPQRKKTYLLSYALIEDSSNFPANSHSLFRLFVVRMPKLCIINHPECAQWRFWSACADAQAHLNLRWAHIFVGTFLDIAAYVLKHKRLMWLDTLCGLIDKWDIFF